MFKQAEGKQLWGSTDGFLSNTIHTNDVASSGYSSVFFHLCLVIFKQSCFANTYTKCREECGKSVKECPVVKSYGVPMSCR